MFVSLLRCFCVGFTLLACVESALFLCCYLVDVVLRVCCFVLRLCGMCGDVWLTSCWRVVLFVLPLCCVCVFIVRLRCFEGVLLLCFCYITFFLLLL